MRASRRGCSFIKDSSTTRAKRGKGGGARQETTSTNEKEEGSWENGWQMTYMLCEMNLVRANFVIPLLLKLSNMMLLIFFWPRNDKTLFPPKPKRKQTNKSGLWLSSRAWESLSFVIDERESSINSSTTASSERPFANGKHTQSTDLTKHWISLLGLLPSLSLGPR